MATSSRPFQCPPVRDVRLRTGRIGIGIGIGVGDCREGGLGWCWVTWVEVVATRKLLPPFAVQHLDKCIFSSLQHPASSL